MDDAIQLMLRVRGGDRAAFAVLYERHATRVHRFFCGLGADAHAARDLGQETFLRIWQHRGRYAATGSFPAYLFTFARFVWLEHCRQIRRSARLDAGSAEELVSLLSATPETRPDERATRSELWASVGVAIAALPEEQRMAFVLQAVQGLTAEEAASVMQCPANTARSRKILAVKKLRHCLQPVWDARITNTGGVRK